MVQCKHNWMNVVTELLQTCGEVVQAPVELNKRFYEDRSCRSSHYSESVCLLMFQERHK